jgi:hypothetical protein
MAQGVSVPNPGIEKDEILNRGGMIFPNLQNVPANWRWSLRRKPDVSSVAHAGIQFDESAGLFATIIRMFGSA